jgi:nucleoside-diphosphate-sugar epimerase
MKVFVAGHKGYIGAHLVDLLRQAGHTVTGCDLGLFDGCAGEEVVPPARDLHIGVGDVTLKDVAGHDCIMHLAAISNDPIGEVDALETYAVNRDASIRIAQLAKTTGVPRYLFAASCSVYGAGKKLDLDETDALNPLTAYAKSKIATEQAVSALADCDFSPVYLRNATAYGIPRCCALTLLSITFSPARCPPARYVSCRTVRLGARHCPSLHRLHECAQGKNPQQNRERRRQS